MLKRYAPLMLLLACAACATTVPAQEKANHARGASMKFQRASPGILLNDYAEKTGKCLELVQGLDTRTGNISLRSEEPLTMQQYLAAIENKLKEHNIGIYPLGSNRLVAAWIDPSKAPKITTQAADMRSKGVTSYLERMRARRAELRQIDKLESEKIGKELQDHLEDYNRDFIRASNLGDTNATPLLAPLTPEQEKGLEVVEMPLPTNERIGGTASNVVIETEPGKLVDALHEEVGISSENSPKEETEND
jgi:hypothetical protein